MDQLSEMEKKVYTDRRSQTYQPNGDSRAFSWAATCKALHWVFFSLAHRVKLPSANTGQASQNPSVQPKKSKAQLDVETVSFLEDFCSTYLIRLV